MFQQKNDNLIGWLGCVPVLSNDDPDLLAFKEQYSDPYSQSVSMRRTSSFDDWVRYCTAYSSMLILKMINTVNAGETSPKAHIIASQIRESQSKVMAIRKSEKKVAG